MKMSAQCYEEPWLLYGAQLRTWYKALAFNFIIDLIGIRCIKFELTNRNQACRKKLGSKKHWEHVVTSRLLFLTHGNRYLNLCFLLSYGLLPLSDTG